MGKKNTEKNHLMWFQITRLTLWETHFSCLAKIVHILYNVSEDIFLSAMDNNYPRRSVKQGGPWFYGPYSKVRVFQKLLSHNFTSLRKENEGDILKLYFHLTILWNLFQGVSFFPLSRLLFQKGKITEMPSNRRKSWFDIKYETKNSNEDTR